MAGENEGGEGLQVEAGEAGGNTATVETFDRPALEGKVTQSLAALFADEETPADETEDPSAKETPAEDAVNEDGEGKTDEDGSSDNTEGATKEEEAAAAATPAPKTGNTPTLPDAYRRSLKAYGWDDEEIDQNMKVMGPSFLVTAQKIHANRNTEIATWADAGRRAREANNKSTEGQPQVFEAMKPIDTAPLKAHYGNDELINAIVNPVNAAIERINQMLPAIQSTQKSSEVSKLETLGRQIESFFSGDKVKPFTEVYGDATKALTETHIVERNKVLELADALMVGAPGSMGRSLSLDDALILALDSVSGTHKAKAARQQIVSTLQAREKGISLKPGNKSKGAASSGQPVKTRADLEKRVGGNLKKVFG